MKRIQLNEDIQPLSAFRSQAASFIQHVQETKRPLVLTQRGRSAAVVLDVGEYERLLETLDLLQEVQRGAQQAGEDIGLSHESAQEALQKRLRE